MLPSKAVKSLYRKRRIIELARCVYEAHNDELCSVIINHLNGSIDLSRYGWNRIDGTAIGYLLEQSRGALKLVDLSYCDIDGGHSLVINSLLSSYKNFCSSKFELNLASFNYGTTSSLIASLFSANYPISKLNIRGNNLSGFTDTVFKSLYHNNMLIELSLGNTLLTSSDMQSLGQMLASNNTLSVMDISCNDIGADYMTDWRNISLHKLIMTDCKLGDSGADKIGKMLSHNKSITSINLGWNSIGDKGVEKLVEHLKCNNTIKCIDLSDNSITSNGAVHLSKLLSCHGTTVNSIELHYNSSINEGVDLILQSITITMEYVRLINTGMTSCSSLSKALHKIKSISFTPPDDCDSISYSLADTTVLKELQLYGGSNAANHAMISGISRNNSIRKLGFHGGQLHHQMLTNFVEVMKIKIITELEIPNMGFFANDHLALADMLTVNTSIKKMTIGLSDMDLSLVLQVLEQLKHNYTLEELEPGVSLYRPSRDHPFIRDVETLVEDINNIRQSHGVTTPLHVKLM